MNNFVTVSQQHERDKFLFKNDKKSFAGKIVEVMKGWLPSQLESEIEPRKKERTGHIDIILCAKESQIKRDIILLIIQ